MLAGNIENQAIVGEYGFVRNVLLFEVLKDIRSLPLQSPSEGDEYGVMEKLFALR